MGGIHIGISIPVLVRASMSFERISSGVPVSPPPLFPPLEGGGSLGDGEALGGGESLGDGLATSGGCEPLGDGLSSVGVGVPPGDGLSVPVLGLFVAGEDDGLPLGDEPPVPGDAVLAGVSPPPLPGDTVPAGESPPPLPAVLPPFSLFELHAASEQSTAATIIIHIIFLIFIIFTQ
jgi:hypothetical protein